MLQVGFALFAVTRYPILILLRLYSHWSSLSFKLIKVILLPCPPLLVNSSIMYLSIEDFADGVKLFKAGRTNFDSRGDQKAKATLNFHRGGMVLALYHLPHE